MSPLWPLSALAVVALTWLWGRRQVRRMDDRNIWERSGDVPPDGSRGTGGE